MAPVSRPPSRSRLPGAVFVLWAVAILVPYLVVSHPLPLRSEVPFGWWAVLVAAAAALVAVIAGKELRALFRESVAPLLLLIPLLIYPMFLITPDRGSYGFDSLWFLVNTAVWAYGARLAIRRWGTAGFLGACWFWFPGLPWLIFPWFTPVLMPAVLLLYFWPRAPRTALVTGRQHWWPLLVLLPLIFLTLSVLQRRWFPYKYFSGIMSASVWSAAQDR